jgi:UDP-N-acetyl-D-mannosaminuronic acid dehydrogenase
MSVAEKMNTDVFSRVSVVGLGYIGLPTAAVLASRGVEVVGVDIAPQTVETINQGNIHIVEPDLDIIVRSAVQMGRLRATTKPEPAEAFMIAVPTPLRNSDPDLSYIQAAAKAIAPVLERGNLVVLESTSPVGTTERLAEWLSAERPDLVFPRQGSEQVDINVAYCPERVLPGHVLHELISNDRVIGGLTPTCAARARQLYEIFVRGECLLSNSRTAEMAKLTENAFRDVNIAFANELSVICDELRINVWELIKLANRHPRVNILNPGPGVGGHCIAVDPWFIVSTTPEKARLIKTARLVNDSKPHHVVAKIKEAADQLKRPVIACFGLSFKANIDDLRESPAVEICEQIARSQLGRVLVVEPHIRQLPAVLQSLGCELVGIGEALEDANVVVMLVDHKQFKGISRVELNMKAVVDTRGMVS